MPYFLKELGDPATRVNEILPRFDANIFYFITQMNPGVCWFDTNRFNATVVDRGVNIGTGMVYCHGYFGMFTMSCVSSTIRLAYSASTGEMTSSRTTRASASANGNFQFMPINDGTELSVSVLPARRPLITEADIPAFHQGLLITQVGDNGFSNAPNLQRVVVPATVNRIGNNAFMGSRSITRVSGMAGVRSIGNTAFALLPNLPDLIFPHGRQIDALSTNVFMQTPTTLYVKGAVDEVSRFGTAWRGNAQVRHTDEIHDDNGNILHYEVRDWQLLWGVNFISGIVVPSFRYNDDGVGAPVARIGDGAFWAVDAPTLRVEQVGATHHNIAFGSNVFMASNIPYISIETSAELDGADSLFVMSKVKEVVLLSDLTVIPSNAFAVTTELSNVRGIGLPKPIYH